MQLFSKATVISSRSVFIGIAPLMAFSNILRLLSMMERKLLNLSTYCSKKLVIDGSTLSLSPRRCSGILALLIGLGSCCKLAMMLSRLLSYDEAEPSLGSIIWMQLRALFDYWMMNAMLALLWRPKTSGVSRLGSTLSIASWKSYIVWQLRQ